MLDISKMSMKDKLTRAKIQMFKKSPFFSYIMTHLNFKEVTDEDIPTMGVDANGNLYWNKKWVKTLPESQLIGVLAHEACHIALLHLERTGTRQNDIFNIANDIIVNDILIQEGFDLPSQGCIPDRYHCFEIPQIGYKVERINEKCSEQIYDEIYPLLPKIKHMIASFGDGDGKGKKGKSKALDGFDKHIYGKKKGKGDGEGDSASKERERKWKKIVGEAAQLAKQRGQMPAGMERRIDDVLNAKINWKQELYQYVTSFIINDFSWNMPSRRYLGLGLYLPRPVKESVKVVVSIDTSGSIGNDELKEFLSEMLGIGNSFPSLNMDIIICDADVHETYQLTKDNIDDILSLKMTGGGGTDHKPVYKYVTEHLQDCKVLINFTDGYTNFPEEPEQYTFQSMWVINKTGCREEDVPFGRVMKLKD
jgi:predicted metal-dependent peptidase